MKAVIIAGGFGTRLQPLTYNTPKPIVPVANQPFIIQQIELLKTHGITEIILNLHYLSSDIKALLGDGKNFGIKIHYSIEAHPLGTAGAVKNAEEFFKDEALIVVLNGDVLTDINISDVIRCHKKNKAKATLTLTPVTDPTPYGLVLTDKNGRVKEFIEKPSWERVEGLERFDINAGIYVLDPKIFLDVPSNTPIMFENAVFPNLLKKGELVFGFPSNAFWMDIGNPSKYRQAHDAILRGEVTSFRIYGSREKGNIFVGEGSEIDKTAKIIGPAIIGKHVKIGAGTIIREYSVIGDHVTIGKKCQLQRTIIWSKCKIGSSVKINDSILGTNCHLEDEVSISEGSVIADHSVISKGSKIGA